MYPHLEARDILSILDRHEEGEDEGEDYEEYVDRNADSQGTRQCLPILCIEARDEVV